MRKLTRRFDEVESNDVRTLEPDQVEIIARVKTDANQALPPLQRLEHSLHPFVSFFVMPVFALGNAGVSFVDMDLAQLFDNHIAVGVMLGLLAGKPLGILSSVWLMERLRAGPTQQTTHLATACRTGLPRFHRIHHVDVCHHAGLQLYRSL